MKSLFIALIFISTSAFAEQSIVCKEITKTGKLRVNGSVIKMNLVYNQNGDLSSTRSKITADGFTRSGSDLLSNLTVGSVNQSPRGTAPRTNFFIRDQEGMLDIQLQFYSRIANQNFRSERARFVIGSDASEPEYSFASGFGVVCNGYLK